jgi:hypothetical protein
MAQQQPLISHLVNEIIDAMSSADLMKLVVSRIQKVNDISIAMNEVKSLLMTRRIELIRKFYHTQNQLSYYYTRSKLGEDNIYLMIDDEECTTGLRIYLVTNDDIRMSSHDDLPVKYIYMKQDGRVIVNGNDRTTTCRIYVQCLDIDTKNS